MKKPQPRDKISYLDEVQYESNQVPGIGNYNPRVLIEFILGKGQDVNLQQQNAKKTRRMEENTPGKR